MATETNYTHKCDLCDQISNHKTYEIPRDWRQVSMNYHYTSPARKVVIGARDIFLVCDKCFGPYSTSEELPRFKRLVGFFKSKGSIK